jgi:hypothetical protein
MVDVVASHCIFVLIAAKIRLRQEAATPTGEPEMSTISFGGKNHTLASLNVSSDVIIFGDGQGDVFLLTGDSNTVTLGNGNHDAVIVSGASNQVTVGNGYQDSAIINFTEFTGPSPGPSTVTLGNGNQDSAVVSSTTPLNTYVTLGDGNHDSVTVTSGIAIHATVGNGNGDTINVNGNENNVYVGNGNGDTVNSNSLNTFIYAGNGLGDTINIAGTANLVDTVFGGRGNTINLIGSQSFELSGSQDVMLFIGSGNSIVVDASTGTHLNIGPAAGTNILLDFGHDLTTGVIDLIGGIGGFTTSGEALAALKSDGAGGTLLSFGTGSSLDIASVLPSALTAANFKIG